jgi:hypothetical protein
VPDNAFKLGVSEQKLNDAHDLGCLINQRGLGVESPVEKSDLIEAMQCVAALPAYSVITSSESGIIYTQSGAYRHRQLSASRKW